MRDIQISEARTRPSELLAAVGNGEQFIIARRGDAVAHFVATVPAAAWRSQPNANDRV